ncbi:hypothetical protein VTK73DRAFT_3653 [Phialemonium thermophilum]|uniref:Uncharacterized protein n=1 Tax=Phialemonium thermophilum TaxID=223376 RepID=A0ABR3WY87_9PEZI
MEAGVFPGFEDTEKGRNSVRKCYTQLQNEPRDQWVRSNGGTALMNRYIAGHERYSTLFPPCQPLLASPSGLLQSAALRTEKTYEPHGQTAMQVVRSGVQKLRSQVLLRKGHGGPLLFRVLGSTSVALRVTHNVKVYSRPYAVNELHWLRT